MKILQILNPVMPFPPVTVGGTERVVKGIVDSLVEYGHEVTLLCHNESVPDGKIKTIGIGTYLDQKNTAKKVWKHLLFNKYDVIHNHGRLLYFLPEVWSSTRKVHTFHMADLENKSFHRFLKLKPRNFTFSPCAKWIKKKYEHLDGDWRYVNNGISQNIYSYNGDLFNEDGPLVIICRMSPGKGVVDAIEIALKANKPLIIAGKVGDYPHEIEWFEKNIANRCDSKQIQFLGPVNDGDKNQLLSKASALLMLSSDSEAFNLTMIEANACGCPVLSYNRYCPPDFIKEGVNGFIGNTQADLVNAVSKIKNINRQECRQFFEENYTSKIMTDRYLELYNS
jgi:glycosyltransferase involved in cell wall biosynthesis